MKTFFVSAAGGFVGSVLGCTVIAVTAVVAGAAIVNLAKKIETGEVNLNSKPEESSEAAENAG